MDKTKIGIVGCGNISGVYFRTCQSFEVLEVAACADLVPQRAEKAAAEHGVPRACTVEEMLADPEIAIVVNLTTPQAHAPVALAALEAGKCVHNEKPLALTREEGRKLLRAARDKGLRVGGAPDTFLGAGHQTCRKAIDDGRIGEPVAAAAFMLCPGHESWHPDPEFYYKPGGGPMFDMGPYYLTALVHLLGPVRRVTGATRISFPQRTITSQPKRGTKIDVEVPTHVVGVLEFASGPIATLVTSFDVRAHELPRIEIYGSDATLSVPDPNGFRGPVRLLRKRGEAQELPLTHPYAENSRGIGVADLAYAMRRPGRAHRCSGELAYHVLDIMHAIHDAAGTGRRVELESTTQRPAPLPTGLREGVLDE